MACRRQIVYCYIMYTVLATDVYISDIRGTSTLADAPGDDGPLQSHFYTSLMYVTVRCNVISQLPNLFRGTPRICNCIGMTTKWATDQSAIRTHFHA